MVCIVASELNQSISRSSSLKGTRSSRKPICAASGSFENVVSVHEIVRHHAAASISHERSAEPCEERILEAVRELYSCSASQTSFNVYAQDVALRDDTGSLSLKGLDRLREHFAALQRAYPIANVLKFRVSPGLCALSTSIIIDLEVAYLQVIDALRPSKIVNGVVVLELSESQEYIVRQSEKWDHASLKPIGNTFPSSPLHR